MGTSVRVFAEALCFWCREDTDLPSSIEMASNKEIGEKYGLHPRDVENIKFAFEVYDFKGDGKVDGFYIGDLIRACNINPTNKTIGAVGGQKEKGRRLSPSRTCTLSSRPPRSPRTPVASTISLRS